MENGDDDTNQTAPKGIQDSIPTVIPPRAKRRAPKREEQEAELEPAPSADNVPTERPAWSDAAESRERPKVGAHPLPEVKQKA